MKNIARLLILCLPILLSKCAQSIHGTGSTQVNLIAQTDNSKPAPQL
jgi:hypothetical protein